MELNKIYNEDCFEGMGNIPDNSIDVVFTSPPYNRKRNDKYANYNDDVDWNFLLNNTVYHSFKILKDDGFLFLNIQKNYYNSHEYFSFLGRYSEYISQVIIWGKNNPMPASGKNITNSYEIFVVLNKKSSPLKAQHTYTKNLFMTNVNSKNKYCKINKAVMNIDTCRKMFADFIGENKIVVDPFMGLGTTAVICKEFNCSYLGFEIDKKYSKMAQERINKININNKIGV